MTPTERAEFERLKREVAELKRFVVIRTNRIELQLPLVVKGHISVGGNGGAMILAGSGSPESNVAAPQGTVYIRTDGGADSTVYYKTSGNENTTTQWEYATGTPA